MNYHELGNRCLLAALLGLGLAPAGLWAAPTVYIAAGNADHVLVVDGIDNGVAKHPTTGGISVIDMQSGELMHHLATGPVPNYAVASADGSRVWVSNSGNDTISEVESA